MSDFELTERNRAVVNRFVHVLYNQRNVEGAFTAFVADDYIQHNPTIPDGRDAAIAVLTPKFAQPGARFVVKRVLVDGDLAVVHLHGRADPSERGGAVVDIFRLANGKIVEHWDVVQPIPETGANPHLMF